MDGSRPLRDIETINLELIFSDIEILERLSPTVKGAFNNKDRWLKCPVKAIKAHLSRTASLQLHPRRRGRQHRQLKLMTGKLVIRRHNVAESDLGHLTSPTTST